MKKRIFIILSLILLGILGRKNYLFSSDFGALNLDIRGYSESIGGLVNTELQKGDIVQGSFVSKYSNLGMVLVRFYNFNRDSNDVINFRIKEVGSDDWYYQAKYNTDQFLPHELFPFGFPPIINSNGRKYVFEIESTKGDFGKGISIDTNGIVFIGRSRFTKNDFSSPQVVLEFLVNKMKNTFEETDSLLNTFTFFIPLIFYIVYLVFKGSSYQYLSLFVLSISFVDIFFINQFIFTYYLSALILWQMVIYEYKFKENVSASFGLVLISILAFHISLKVGPLGEKTSLWIFLFLISIYFQNIIGKFFKINYTFSSGDFFNSFSKFKLNVDSRYIKIYHLIKRPLLLVTFASLSIYSVKNNLLTLQTYREFYPDNYNSLFTYNILYPQLLALSALLLLFLKIFKNKKNWSLYLVVLFIIYLLFSSNVIERGTGFKNTPKIISIQPSIVMEAWTDVVITGKNFGERPFVGQVLINENEQNVIEWTNNKIIFRTNPISTGQGSVIIKTQGGKSTGSADFKYLFGFEK